MKDVCNRNACQIWWWEHPRLESAHAEGGEERAAVAHGRGLRRRTRTFMFGKGEQSELEEAATAIEPVRTCLAAFVGSDDHVCLLSWVTASVKRSVQPMWRLR